MTSVQLKLRTQIGLNIKKGRMNLGLNQRDFGLRCNLSIQQLLRYEKGQAEVGIRILHRLAQELNVSLVYFFEGVEEPWLVELQDAA